MRWIQNQNGFAAIMVSMVVFMMVVSLLLAGSSTFQTLYGQIDRQRRTLAGIQVVEGFAVMAQQAHEVYKSSGCGPNYDKDAVNEMCWPKASGANPNANCIRNPLGDSAAGAQWICRQPGQGGVVRNAMQVVQLEIQHLPFENEWDRFDSMVAQMKTYSEIILNVLAEKVTGQIVALAQTSEMAHMPALAGSPVTRFAAAATCPLFPAPIPDETVCKRCDGTSLERCLQFRICLRPGGCNSGEDLEWTFQTIGFMPR